jgi:L-Ala-D/L-Glu epimerase
LNVVLLEQPVAIAEDEILRGLSLHVPIAADEAFTQASDVHALIGKYQVLNIKLDKTGGLTEALLCARKGIQSGFSIMVGCMIGSSLSMAPGMVVAQLCDYVDLDGPLLQAEDVDHPITYDHGVIMPPTSQLWG